MTHSHSSHIQRGVINRESLTDIANVYRSPYTHSEFLKDAEQPGSAEQTLEPGSEATYSNTRISDDVSRRSKKRLPPMGPRGPKPKNLRMVRASQILGPIILER